MTAGRVVRGAGGLALVLVLVLAHGAARAEGGNEIRVLSGPAAASVVTIEAVPGAVIEDRTTGAHPAAEGRGPASVGETFTGEITLFLRGHAASRSTSIDVGDDLVSTVRLFPEGGGTTVSVFVRQPVTYTVSRPSAIGEVRIELHPRRVAVAPQAGRRRPHAGARLSRPVSSPEGEVAVDAESLSYDQQSNTLTARGGVTLTRGDATLTADEVVYDRTNEIAEARGHVVVTDPQATVEGDFAHLNLADETGWIESANADLQANNYVLRAGRIEKEGGPRYAIADGVFTTCECGGLEKPSWSILGHSTHVTLQGTGVVRGLTFRVKDVPVVWLPYFVFPANTQRQTGFLMPRVGYSNRRGFQYEQPFYWAINKSSDATVALDVESAARIGAIAEYRYRLSRNGGGEFLGAYYNESIRGRQNEGTITQSSTPNDTPENRFLLAGHHSQTFGKADRYYLDLFAVSDDLFLREINSFALSANQDFALRTTRFTTSRTGFIRAWDRGLASIEAAYFQDLIDPRKLAPQRLPRVEVEHAVPLLGDRLLGRISAETVDYQREEGFDGLRGYVAPELFLPLNLGRFVHGSLAGRLSETAYHLTDQEQVAVVIPNANVFPGAGYERFRPAAGLPQLDTNHTRELAEVHGQLGSEIGRVFDFPHFGLEKLRHTIEPEIQYLFIPQVGRPIFQKALPACSTIPGGRPGIDCDATLFSEGYLFDERDAINRRNFVSYGLSTRLLGRGPTAAESAAHPPAAVEEPEEDDFAGEIAPIGSPIDMDSLAPGIPSSALPEVVGPPPPPPEMSPDFVGPPTPPGLLPPMKGPPPAPRELVRASILQGFDISRELVGSSHLSDVDLGIRVSPLDYLAVSYNATVNFDQGDVRGQGVGVVMREPWWTPSRLARYQTASTIALGYRFIEKNVNAATGLVKEGSPESQLLASGGLNELQGSLYLRLGDYLGFTFIARYDLNKTKLSATDTLGPHFLERDYLLRLISRCNCWILEAGVADKTNPDERLFRVQLTLVGLGSFGEGPGRFARNYVNMPGMGGLRRMAGVSGGGY